MIEDEPLFRLPLEPDPEPPVCADPCYKIIFHRKVAIRELVRSGVTHLKWRRSTGRLIFFTDAAGAAWCRLMEAEVREWHCSLADLDTPRLVIIDRRDYDVPAPGYRTVMLAEADGTWEPVDRQNRVLRIVQRWDHLRDFSKSRLQTSPYKDAIYHANVLMKRLNAEAQAQAEAGEPLDAKGAAGGR